MNIKNRRQPLFSLVFAGLLATAAMAAPGPFEEPTPVKAASLLPASIISGANSQVLDPVETDGYLYIYKLQTDSGEMSVVSTETLYLRVHEFDVIAQMDKLSSSKEFTGAVEASAKGAAQGVVNLVTDPIDTTKKAVSGVGRLFKKIGHAVSGDGSSNGNTVANVTGFSKVERAYAQKFQVDPYSRNPYLQKKLKDVSKAGFMGGLITKLGLGAVGGAAGTFLTVSSTTNSLAQLVTTKSSGELTGYNSDILKGMGVDEDLVELFLKNDNYTPTEQTAIVVSLAAMEQTKGREAFIKFAILTDNEDVAAFRARQAAMYSAFNAKVKPIREFVFLGQFAAALLEDNALLIIAPVDHMLWTEPVASYVTAATSGASSKPHPRKILWLGGTASPLTVENMKKNGWEVRQKVADQLKAKSDEAKS